MKKRIFIKSSAQTQGRKATISSVHADGYFAIFFAIRYNKMRGRCHVLKDSALFAGAGNREAAISI